MTKNTKSTIGNAALCGMTLGFHELEKEKANFQTRTPTRIQSDRNGCKGINGCKGHIRN